MNCQMGGVEEDQRGDYSERGHDMLDSVKEENGGVWRQVIKIGDP